MPRWFPGSKLRVRLSHADDIAVAAIQRAKGITFTEAARLYLGSNQPQSADATPVAPAQSAPVEPPASVALVAKIEALQTEIANDRNADPDVHLSAEHQDKRDRLNDLKADLRIARADEARDARDAQAHDATSAQAARARLDADQAAAAIDARKQYPALTDESSALFNAAQVAHLEMQRANDPRLQRPDAIFTIVQLAADRLATQIEKNKGIPKATTLAALRAPATAAPAVAKTSPPAPTLQPRRVTAASGSRGQVNGGQPSTLGAAIAAANTPEDLDWLFEEAHDSGLSLGGGRR